MKPLILPRRIQNGWLILSGGGEFSFGETKEFDGFALAHMQPSRRSIAFLPTASGSLDYAKRLGEYFTGMAPDTTFMNVPVYRGRDVRREKNLEMIRSAGMVYVGGGTSNQLLETIIDSPVVIALEEAVSNGAVIFAIGGAASAFGTLTRSMTTGGAPLRGLDWLPRTVIDGSYDPAMQSRTAALLESEEVDAAVGLPAGSALAIAPDGAAQILGDASIAVLRKNKPAV